MFNIENLEVCLTETVDTKEWEGKEHLLSPLGQTMLELKRLHEQGVELECKTYPVKDGRIILWRKDDITLI